MREPVRGVRLCIFPVETLPLTAFRPSRAANSNSFGLSRWSSALGIARRSESHLLKRYIEELARDHTGFFVVTYHFRHTLRRLSSQRANRVWLTLRENFVLSFNG